MRAAIMLNESPVLWRSCRILSCICHTSTQERACAGGAAVAGVCESDDARLALLAHGLHECHAAGAPALRVPHPAGSSSSSLGVTADRSWPPVISVPACCAKLWLTLKRADIFLHMQRADLFAVFLAQAMFVTCLGGDLSNKMWSTVPVWAFYLINLIFAMYTLVRRLSTLPCHLCTCQSPKVHLNLLACTLPMSGVRMSAVCRST